MRRSSRSWRRVALAAVLAALVAGFAGPADAQGKGKGKAKRGDRIPVNVIVVYTSDAEGGVDPRARELDAKLKKQLRYKSMRVLQEERVYLDVDRVGTVKLPDGRAVRMRPMHKDEKGVLMAVDVPGAVNLDARTPNHHKVVIGAGEYEDGNLAISIEPDYEE